jgi:hypothetical protein
VPDLVRPDNPDSLEGNIAVGARDVLAPLHIAGDTVGGTATPAASAGVHDLRVIKAVCDEAAAQLRAPPSSHDFQAAREQKAFPRRI